MRLKQTHRIGRLAPLVLLALGAHALAQPTPVHLTDRATPRQTARVPGPARAVGPITPLAERSIGPGATVFGFLPYWVDDDDINYELITHLACFSIEINEQGDIINDRGWPWIDVINAAHANGVKVALVVTLFNTTSINTLITTPAYRQAFFDNITTELSAGNADAINIDFEGWSTTTWHASINAFMSELRQHIDTNLPGVEISFDAPPCNWTGTWDFPGLASPCDHLFVMGYDFWGSWSSTTGPSAPLVSGSCNITFAIDSTFAGVPPEKLVLGVPYYGNHWRATSSAPGASVLSWIGSVRYRTAANDPNNTGWQWHASSQTPYYTYHDGADWHQVWADNEQSLSLKYDLALDRELRGVGMWAADYDEGRIELWRALANKFNDGLCRTDLNGDLRADVEDLYAWHALPEDVDCSESVEDADRSSLAGCIRREEPADIGR